MKVTFYVSNEDVERVKMLVRKYSSLRFLSNPMKIVTEHEFCLEGTADDFNTFFEEPVFQKVKQTNKTLWRFL